MIKNTYSAKKSRCLGRIHLKISHAYLGRIADLEISRRTWSWSQTFELRGYVCFSAWSPSIYRESRIINLRWLPQFNPLRAAGLTCRWQRGSPSRHFSLSLSVSRSPKCSNTQLNMYSYSESQSLTESMYVQNEQCRVYVYSFRTLYHTEAFPFDYFY